jgi:hypothetical protein
MSYWFAAADYRLHYATEHLVQSSGTSAPVMRKYMVMWGTGEENKIERESINNKERWG